MKIDSLRPTLMWEPVEYQEDDVSYDFAIWEDEGGIFWRASHAPFFKDDAAPISKAIYYKEGITKWFHEVQITLKPQTFYIWSVRIRNGDSISKWASFDYNTSGLIGEDKRNWPFRFKTPAQ